MTIPFHRDGVSLLVTEPLLVLLNQEAVKYDFDLEQLTRLTFSFRNPDYQPQSGGVHPVEIQLIRGLDGWLFDYVTDLATKAWDKIPSSAKNSTSTSWITSTTCKAGDRSPWRMPKSYSTCGRTVFLPTPIWAFLASLSVVTEDY